MFRRLTLVALLGLTPLPFGPAQALDGMVTLNLTPRTQDEANLLRLGLGLYALHQHVRDGGSVRQFGQDNAAALLQSGGNTWGYVQQRGSGHEAVLAQTGGQNAQAIFQSGKNTQTYVQQNGGEVGLTFLHGF